MRPSLRLVLALALAVAAAFGAAACGDGGGGGGGQKQGSAAGGKPSMPDYAGAVAQPPKPAPPLRLEDSTGKTFDIAEHRGKVVMLTWLYVNCPDVCPLIVSNLKVARSKLGAKARDVVMVAVSTDPKRDTPKAVNKFLASRGAQDEVQYLVGGRRELERTWKNWGIVAEPAAANPELIEHASPIYGISASGKITTLYPANFKPQQIVDDVPLLLEH